MTKLLEIYKCSICGNMVEIVHSAEGVLSCCKADMAKQEENTVDAAHEKHIPVATIKDNIIEVNVGDISHPMEDGHYIEWIEVNFDWGGSYKKFLKPGDKPKATFNMKEVSPFTLRAYCNLHGLWQNKG